MARDRPFSGAADERVRVFGKSGRQADEVGLRQEQEHIGDVSTDFPFRIAGQDFDQFDQVLRGVIARQFLGQSGHEVAAIGPRHIGIAGPQPNEDCGVVDDGVVHGSQYA
ncbi:MAG: hypothetical protein GXY58_18630 [Planctomycetaceae bacterium]|nr:hypothetical protein [Planctomycetaceae bacterium]